MPRSLFAFINDRRVGELIDNDGTWRFAYDAAWQADPNGFDLSPALDRRARIHADDASRRTVQWYFDNLLPEEHLREVVAKDANIAGDDAFALLTYLGAESAGSIVLLPPGAKSAAPASLKRLADDVLNRRIQNLPRTALTHDAPKRMSAAGAQSKLLVVFRDDALWEPVGEQPSTHLLKPNHPGDDYLASVINEYAVMRLAAALGLAVPPVFRRYVPEPTYLVERFDRFVDAEGRVQRRHVIDACQLLDLSRVFKYRSATLERLRDVVQRCRNRAGTRLRLFEWLVFNVLIGNEDNHLKNLSFLVGPQGIELAPSYDLLSTALYHVKAFANERANWPRVKMAIELPGAQRLDEVSRGALLAAGAVLGVPRVVAERMLDRLTARMPGALDEVIGEITRENENAPPDVRRFLGGEARLLRVLQKIVVTEMLERAKR